MFSYNIGVESFQNNTLLKRKEMKRTLKVLLILGLSLSMTIGAFAQEQEEQKDPMKWNGDLSFGISVAKGNTDAFTLSFTFAANKKLSEKFEWKNRGIFLGGRSDGVVNSQSLELTSTGEWNHSPRFFSHYEIHGIHDRFRNFKYRIVPSIGVGYKLVQSEASELSLKSGLSETFTKFYNSGETASFAGVFIGNDFLWKISSSAEFKQLSSFGLDLSDTKHVLAQIEMSLSAAIVKNWAIKLSLIDKYDSAPETEGVKKNDLTFLTNISWKF
jgi:putative salt-induced outer membrane protein YdiY